MKETYLSRDFRETAAQCFPSQAKELNAFFDARLNVLLAENADASKEKQYHLKRQISWLCGGAGENEPQTACRPAAYSGALPPCPRRFCQIHTERFRPGGGL